MGELPPDPTSDAIRLRQLLDDLDAQQVQARELVERAEQGIVDVLPTKDASGDLTPDS